MSKTLTGRQMDVLYGVMRVGGQGYSSDIAHWLREETHWIASAMKALEKKAMVRCAARGGNGKPAIWEITKEGRLALKEADK